MKCPHCGAWASARSTEDVTRTARKGWFQCTNIECGHTFTAALTVLETLSPSAMPDPTVVIPQSQHIRRGVLGHQLERAPLSDYCPRSDAAQQATRELFDERPSTLPPHLRQLVPKPG